MKKKRHGTGSKKIAPTLFHPAKDANCKKCGDTGLCPDIDTDGYSGFHFCSCSKGVIASKTYERGKCPLCQNGNFAIRWKIESGRRKYRQVRCPHFHKNRK